MLWLTLPAVLLHPKAEVDCIKFLVAGFQQTFCTPGVRCDFIESMREFFYKVGDEREFNCSPETKRNKNEALPHFCSF